MDDEKLSPRDEFLVRLMELAPYRALTLRMQETLVDGKTHVVLPKEDLRAIIKHFLHFLPFDDRSYLESSRDVEKAIAERLYRGSPFQHFINSGYFEGRRPIPNYLPEEHDFEAATQERPRGYFTALYQATAAYADCDYPNAEHFLRKALAFCPKSYQANRLLGYVLYRTARPNEALQLLIASDKIKRNVPEICLWLSSTYQILAMSEDRVASLAGCSELSGPKNVGVARAYAEALRELGHLKRAHFIYAALPIEAFGGGEVAAKDRVARALNDARRLVRALARKARSSTLCPAEKIELAQGLGRVGFEKLSGLLVNRVVTEFRHEAVAPDSAMVVQLAEAARISQGVQGAIRVLSIPEFSNLLDADGNAYKGTLLYRSGNLRGTIELLSGPGGRLPSNELALQYLVLALLRSGQLAAGLDICRSWMIAHPQSTRWAGLALLILASRGDLSFMRVPSRNGRNEDRSWESGLIPAHIVQFWSDPLPPPDVETAMSSWEKNNPEFRYHRFNDSSAREFLASHFGSLHAEVFDACHHPAMRADYFRLGYLSKLGGFYVDADERSRLPLSKALAERQQKSAIFVFKDRAYIPNSPLCCAPQHPLIVAALEAATSALLDAKRLQRKLDTWQSIGPGLVTRLVAKELLTHEKGGVPFFGETAFLREIDASRVSAEGMLDYKNSTDRNWRFH